MRDQQITETILMMFTSRDEALTLAGDLGEMSLTRGSFWLALAVARSVWRLIWRDFATAPVSTIWLALRGFCLTLIVLGFFRGIPIGLMLESTDFSNFHRPTILGSYGLIMAYLGGTVLAQGLVGMWLSKRSCGHGWAAFVCYLAVFAVSRFVLNFSSGRITGPAGAEAAGDFTRVLEITSVFLVFTWTRLKRGHQLPTA